MSDDKVEGLEEGEGTEQAAPESLDELVETDVVHGAGSESEEPKGSSSIFDAFEPPPDVDPNKFGPIPVVKDLDDRDFPDDVPIVDLIGDAAGLSSVGPAVRDLAPGVESVQIGEAAPERVERERAEAKANAALPGKTVRSDSSTSVDSTGLSASTGLPEIGALPDIAALGEVSAASESTDLDGTGLDGTDSHNADAGLEPTSDAGALLADLFGDEPGAETKQTQDQSAQPKAVSNPEVEVEAPTDLPHWTEPATGQVPAVVSGDQDEVWTDLSGPRWHGEGPEWAGDDIADVFGFTPVEDEESAIDDEAHENEDLPGVAGSPQRAPIPRRKQASTQAAADSSGRNIPQAIAVGVGIAAIALAAFHFGRVPTLILVTVLAILGSLELFNKMREVGVHPATLLGVVASASLPIAVYHRGPAGFMMVATFAVVFGALWYIVGADHHRPALNIGLTLLGVLWVGGLASFASLIIWLPDGISILLFAVVCTVVFDTAAYAGGRAFGKRPFHSASPNKTWEGTIAGVVGSVAAAFVLGLFVISPFSADLKHAALVGVVIGVLGPLGDLTESMIKRDLGVKDMGTLLPGHGGVLDRIDGLLFVLPGVYYLSLLLL